MFEISLPPSSLLRLNLSIQFNGSYPHWTPKVLKLQGPDVFSNVFPSKFPVIRFTLDTVGLCSCAEEV